MCTYNISINDNLLQRAQGAFGSTESMRAWIQKKVETLLMQHIAEAETRDEVAKSTPKVHALSEFRGILKSDQIPDVVREEYIEEKYGV